MREELVQRGQLGRTQLLMVVVSIAPLAVLLYISWAYVFPALQQQGQNIVIYSVAAVLVCTVVAVCLGYFVVRRDTERSLAAIADGERRLERLFRASGDIAGMDQPQAVREAILKAATSLVGAERAAIWEVQGEELHVAACVGVSDEKARENPIPIGMGLVGIAAAGHMTLREMEPDEYDREWDSRVYTRTRSDLVVPIIRDHELIGVLDLRNKGGGGRFTDADQRLAESLSSQVVVYLENARNRTLQANFTLQATTMIRELCERGLSWPGHVENVQRLCAKIGKRLGIGRTDQDEMRNAALLKDIGLLDVEDPKSGPAGGPPEHAVKGGHRLEKIHLWTQYAEIVRLHAERMDGAGPLGVPGFKLPMTVRILILAEYIDTVTNPASPWGKKSMDELVRELKADEGARFCPQCVTCFLKELGG